MQLSLKCAAAALLSTLLVAPALLPGQEPPARPEPKQQQPEQHDEASSFTGCVMQVEGGSFALKTKQEGTIILGGGAPELAKHLGHTVEIKGKMTQDQGKQVLRAGQLKHVANSCTE